MNNTDIEKGAHNLLVNCAELQPDESLLILCEDPALGWYDAATPQAIADYARALGVEPTLMQVGCPQNEPDLAIGAAINAHDCTLYLPVWARLCGRRVNYSHGPLPLFGMYLKAGLIWSPILANPPRKSVCKSGNVLFVS